MTTRRDPLEVHGAGHRLVGAVLGELHDDWAVVRRYMTIEVQPHGEQPKLEDNVKRAA